ncbi:MAG: antibiotic biosynthesis monooxygenase [Chloroflexi bacterium]|nr:antibiotic biosynthesis monooxygenase [Chloroflexota bacterium]
MSEYITLRRWTLKEGADEAALVALVRDGIAPAYKQQPGCKRLQLLRLIEQPQSYLAATVWDDKAAFERWAGPHGQSWRDAHRLTLERWLELMSFNEEWSADVVFAG